MKVLYYSFYHLNMLILLTKYSWNNFLHKIMTYGLKLFVKLEGSAEKYRFKSLGLFLLQKKYHIFVRSRANTNVNCGPFPILNYDPLLQPYAQMRLEISLSINQSDLKFGRLQHHKSLHRTNTNLSKPNGRSRNLNVCGAQRLGLMGSYSQLRLR